MTESPKLQDQSTPERAILQLSLFGAPQICLNGTPVNGLGAKDQALLFYLATTGQTHMRTTLSTLLWGELLDKNARASLRKALQHLRDALPGHLHCNTKSAALLMGEFVWVDAVEFSKKIERAKQANDINMLTEAAGLYQADFLAGFLVRNTSAYEAWQTAQQARLRGMMISVLQMISQSAVALNDLKQAIATTCRILQMEPWREESHCRLMELFAQSGERGAALAQYEICCEALMCELSVEPSAATVELMEKIRSGEFEERFPAYGAEKNNVILSCEPRHCYQPSGLPSIDPQFVAGPPITQPHLFFGRNEELARIFGWWQTPPLAHITLIGPRRSGKTSLLLHLRSIAVAKAAHLRPNQKSDWLPSSAIYRWVQIDFQDPRMRCQNRLLCHMLTGFGLSAPDNCSLETFMDIAYARQWTTPTIVLMDELGAGLAATELDQPFWWALRALTQATDGYLAFVIASHDQPMRLAEDQGKTSPFFNIFTTLKLGPFTQDEALALIATSPIPFEDADAAWMLEQSQRWPYLLQICCQERLRALECNEHSDRWQQAAIEQIEPFGYLRGES